MDELGLNVIDAVPWFVQIHDKPFLLISVPEAHANLWTTNMFHAVRRCYITDGEVASSSKTQGLPQKEIIGSKLPDAGSVMSGDFGEILAYIFHAARAHPKLLIGPKKWRLKQDRRKPAPHSDVLHFFLPDWPNATSDDSLYCSEVKAKATSSNSTPVTSAISDSAKDRTSRLARTLVWLRERALTQNFGAIQRAHIERFINATDYPAATRHFFAIAVICSSEAADELKIAAQATPTDSTLVVILVPHLKAIYSAVFDAAANSSVESAP
jgi:hypothetical protein